MVHRGLAMLGVILHLAQALELAASACASMEDTSSMLQLAVSGNNDDDGLLARKIRQAKSMQEAVDEAVAAWQIAQNSQECVRLVVEVGCGENSTDNGGEVSVATGDDVETDAGNPGSGEIEWVEFYRGPIGSNGWPFGHYCIGCSEGTGPNGNFRHFIPNMDDDMAERVLFQARVWGGSCGDGATIQFRSGEQFNGHSPYGNLAKNFMEKDDIRGIHVTLLDVQVVAGNVPNIPEVALAGDTAGEGGFSLGVDYRNRAHDWRPRTFASTLSYSSNDFCLSHRLDGSNSEMLSMSYAVPP